jgi:hypothetical protein|tara:strand:+ start:225 stop:449 length:225 start_codon:yes stop_codon:yes gene_type:complete
MVMSSNKFQWENLLEHEEVAFLVDPNGMSPDERHELIESLYVDYLKLRATKKTDKSILANYKKILRELVKNFAH